jgi:hypothetical protein
MFSNTLQRTKKYVYVQNCENDVLFIEESNIFVFKVYFLNINLFMRLRHFPVTKVWGRYFG